MNIYNHKITTTLAVGGTSEVTLRMLGFDTVITGISVNVIHNGNRVITPDSENREKITVQINDVANKNTPITTDSIDVFELAEIGSSPKFQAFLLPADSIVKFSFKHYSANINTGTLNIELNLSGKISEGTVKYNLKNLNIIIAKLQGLSSNEIYQQVFTPSYPIDVKVLSCYQHYAGNNIGKNSSMRDPVQIQIEEIATGWKLSSSPIDIHNLNDIGKGYNFDGFKLQAEATYKITLRHDKIKQIEPSTIDVVFMGYEYKEE